MIISGGLDTAEDARRAYEESGADAVMIARGSLGNPWIFEELTGRRDGAADREEMVAELLWVIDRAEEHLGPERAARYLRKFYPWYLERLERTASSPPPCSRATTSTQARRLVARASSPVGRRLHDADRPGSRAWRDAGRAEDFGGRASTSSARDGERAAAAAAARLPLQLL